MMHHSATVCSDSLEMLAASCQAVTTAAGDSNQTSSHGCVQPLVVNARPVILVSGHKLVHDDGCLLYTSPSPRDS